ncbi:winged helix-turn-helix transcriptional regulator [Streptomyces sp. TRM66268-LWL]|uniref:Winged helix-turn-helix transcriptional regulator n=1 Tax=Streptomyces polyasparticus TaxID=2767826 RepID=A0ABR7SNF4_9ACTN|nr:winged helix-turn-helix domain-containing protein [Streptomyces polyasparticus]MBC9716899.1 winged helix-turn-helix transcriptional regulator [Streptomyces polyasparticus]
MDGWKPGQRPTAKEIAAHYQKMISDGRYRPGDQLPAARALAKYLEVGYMTVQSGYGQLAAAGLAQKEQGRGTFVRAVPDGDNAQPVATVDELAERLAHVTSQLSDLQDRVALLESERRGSADENQ